jgi:hypothetical protein
MRRGMRQALARLAVVPFEAAIAALLAVYGVAALAGYGIIDPVAALLPAWEATALSVMSVATGVLITAGTAVPHRGAETAGLLFLVAVIACRFLLFGYYLGYGSQFVTTGVFDTGLVWAAGTRLSAIRRGLILIRADQL